MLMRKALTAAIVPLLAGSAVAFSVAAADPPAAMLLIDGSGSMWGRLEPDRRAKVDLIREQLTGVLAAVPNVRVGVASYGHRRRGDCRDAEVIASVNGPRDAAVAAIAKLDPRGKGPLVAGLTAAMADIGQTRPAAVLLITDGVDNCQQDACAAAAELAKSAPGVPIHTVTVGVNPSDWPRLSCIANATGGSVFEARDPASLAAAIDAASKIAMLAPDAPADPTVATAPPSPPPPGAASLRATLALNEGAATFAAPARWRVYPRGGKTKLSEAEGPELSVKLEPGNYEIEAEVGRVTARRTVSLEAGAQQNLSVPLNAGRLIVKASNVRGAPASATAIVTIAPNDDSDETVSASIVHSGAADVVLPPGSYKVTIADSAIRRLENVALTAGQAKTIDAVLDAGRLELSAAGADGALLDDVTYRISADDPESADGRRDVARARAARPAFTLPAGTYYVEASSGAGRVRDRVAVGAGEIITRTLALPLVGVKLSAEIAGSPAGFGQGLVYRIAELDGDQREVVRSLQPTIETALLPGRYRIAARLDAHHITAEREVTIEAGKPAIIVLAIPAGEVRLKAQAGGGDVYWEILDAAGKSVWRSQLAEAKALLAPGSYKARYASGDRRLVAAFDVKAGEKRDVELGVAAP